MPSPTSEVTDMKSLFARFDEFRLAESVVRSSIQDGKVEEAVEAATFRAEGRKSLSPEETNKLLDRVSVLGLDDKPTLVRIAALQGRELTDEMLSNYYKNRDLASI